MTSTKHHVYRTTTDKLAEAMDDIVADGGTILQAAFAGGRDWVVLWVKDASPDTAGAPARLCYLGPGLVPPSARLQKTLDGLASDVARIRRDIERGARRGMTAADRSRAGR